MIVFTDGCQVCFAQFLLDFFFFSRNLRGKTVKSEIVAYAQQRLTVTAPLVANIQHCIRLDNMRQSPAKGIVGFDIQMLSHQESIASLHSTF